MKELIERLEEAKSDLLKAYVYRDKDRGKDRIGIDIGGADNDDFDALLELLRSKKAKLEHHADRKMLTVWVYTD